MPRLVRIAHDLVRQVVREGDWAIDATVGNGHDTLFLSQLVGDSGRVFGCDIQPAAIGETARRLQAAGARNVELFACDHARLADFLPPDCAGCFAAVMLNLGYLPGGELPVATATDSTLAALGCLTGLLRPAGVLAVIAYTGHTGGAEETEAVRQFFNELPNSRFRADCHIPAATGAPPPELYVAWRISDSC